MSDMTLGDLITKYIQLRDAKKELAAKQRVEIEKYTAAMESIQEYFKQYLTANNMQNVATQEGTAFLKTTRSATVADKSLFREHVIASGEFDLANFTAAADAVEDWIKAHEGNLPPGVNYQTFVEVGVQRK